MHRGKVDPGVSELPRGNELSRDHVNRPYVLDSCRADIVGKLLMSGACLSSKVSEPLSFCILNQRGLKKKKLFP